MSITAVVEKGLIKLPKDVPWASGTVVRIEPVDEQPPTLLETLKDFDGMAGGLPDDLSINLDYYLHGHAHKQQPRRGRWIAADNGAPELTGQEASAYADKLLELAGETRHLPPDLSTNHDHYLHGLPK